jgi:hypothetical protein
MTDPETKQMSISLFFLLHKMTSDKHVWILAKFSIFTEGNICIELYHTLFESITNSTENYP